MFKMILIDEFWIGRLVKLEINYFISLDWLFLVVNWIEFLEILKVKKVFLCLLINWWE